jgi:DNA-binding phage protein
MDDLPNLIRAGLEQLVAKLNEPDCNVSELARLSGVATKTLYRVRDGENTPNVETIEKVLRAFQALESAPHAEEHTDRRAITGDIGAEARHTALGDPVIDNRRREGPTTPKER